MTAAHYTHSTLRERIAEHVFVDDTLRTRWRLGIHDVEVLRSEFDAHSYDLVMARGPIVRHIQFESGTAKDLRRSPWHGCLQKSRAAAPSGCASTTAWRWDRISGSEARRANRCRRSATIPMHGVQLETRRVCGRCGRTTTRFRGPSSRNATASWRFSKTCSANFLKGKQRIVLIRTIKDGC